MEYSICLLIVVVCAMPTLSSSSWVSDRNPHFLEVPIIQHHNSHFFTPGVANPVHLASYQGPIAIPVVLPSGHLADTPEVSHAKHHHLSVVAQTKADQYYKGYSEHGYGGAYGYTGSYKGYAVPVVLPNGHIADTPQVAAAKSAHLLAVAKAKADEYYSGHGEGYGLSHSDHEYGFSGSFHGYGIPVVLPSGHIADTHEVAAAKSAHLLAVAHTEEKQAYHYLEDSTKHYKHHHQPYLYPLYVHGSESLHRLQYRHYLQ